MDYRRLLQLKNSPLFIIRTKDYLRIANHIIQAIQKENKKNPSSPIQFDLFSPALETFAGKEFDKEQIVRSIQEGKILILILPPENFFNADELQYFVGKIVQKENSPAKIFIISPTLQIPVEIEGYVEEINDWTIEDGLNTVELKRAEELGGKVEFRKRKLDGTILEIFSPKDFEKAIGLEETIELIRKMAQSKLGRGTLLLGVPGVGKTLIAKNLTKYFTVIKFNVSLIYNKYVGESEKRLREAIGTLKEFGEAIVFIDEFEKLMAGGNGDSGVSRRLLGELLQWLEESKDQYVLATANDISQLPVELLRTGRWDFILGITPPPQNILKEIVKYYSKKYSLSEIQFAEGTTPSDIATIYRIGKVIGLEKARQMIKLTKETATNWDGLIEMINRYAINIWQTKNETKNLI